MSLKKKDMFTLVKKTKALYHWLLIPTWSCHVKCWPVNEKQRKVQCLTQNTPICEQETRGSNHKLTGLVALAPEPQPLNSNKRRVKERQRLPAAMTIILPVE